MHVEYFKNLSKLDVYAKANETFDEKSHDSLKIHFEGIDDYVATKHEEYTIFTFRNVILRLHIPENPFRLPMTALDFTTNTKITCSNCNSSILKDPEEPLVAKDLPSSFWMELVDCWSCHKSEFAGLTEKVQMSQHGSMILPKPGNVHCGLGFMLFHHADVHQRCINCSRELGTLVDGAVKVHKHSIVMINCRETINEVDPLRILAAEMYERMEAHGSFNFSIISDSSNIEPINLRLINWNLLAGELDSLKPSIKVSTISTGTNLEQIQVDCVVFNILSGFLAKAWPRLKTIHGDELFNISFTV